MPMSTEDKSPAQDKPAEKPAEKPEPKAKADEPKADDDEPKRPENLTKEELEAVRRDIFRMWHEGPEETR